ncbi:hypothetical protein ebA26 [Aromatoleum aromaticum EbN1]|uniref:Uncharacterized protein n=1 Tax=Aromatoleum aromaticum (strain DSM 19018 / LMG 30748 / EbN1) TaxID=76114 RepID=Q5P977_AROAE|nr:hypothetical protein ebA26 [Aromatoleum aromaticum EbN1]
MQFNWSYASCRACLIHHHRAGQCLARRAGVKRRPVRRSSLRHRRVNALQQSRRQHHVAALQRHAMRCREHFTCHAPIADTSRARLQGSNRGQRLVGVSAAVIADSKRLINRSQRPHCLLKHAFVVRHCRSPFRSPAMGVRRLNSTLLPSSRAHGMQRWFVRVKSVSGRWHSGRQSQARQMLLPSDGFAFALSMAKYPTGAAFGSCRTPSNKSACIRLSSCQGILYSCRITQRSFGPARKAAQAAQLRVGRHRIAVMVVEPSPCSVRRCSGAGRPWMSACARLYSGLKSPSPSGR